MVALILTGCPIPIVCEESTSFSTDKFFVDSLPTSIKVKSGLFGMEDNLSLKALTAVPSQSFQSCFLKSESRMISLFKFFPSATILSAWSNPESKDIRSPWAFRESFLRASALGSEVGFSKTGVVIPPS